MESNKIFSESTLRALLITADFFASAALAEPGEDAYGGPFWSRTKLTGDWAGIRERWAEHGLTLDFDATHVTQHVAEGGLEGPRFRRRFPGIGDTESNALFNMLLKLDTGKAGLWPGGFLTARGEGRVGESVNRRAGSVSPVNADGLLPAVEGKADEDVLALTELTYAQFFSERLGLLFGLLNTTESDNNEFAGSLRSRSHFLNTAFRFSPVVFSTVPTVTLGVLAVILPTENVTGTVGVFNSEESAGHNPFEKDVGTTFNTEWTFKHTLAGLPGGQAAGFVYGWGRDRIDLRADPRVQLFSLIAAEEEIVTREDTWALYYNGHQYLHGDETGGFGIFLRAGVSDGHPNPIRWNLAFGLGGRRLVTARPDDTWGVGGYALGISDEPVINALGIEDESGFEAWYNFAVTPWLHITGDLQYVDSAIPGASGAWVIGLRSQWNF